MHHTKGSGRLTGATRKVGWSAGVCAAFIVLAGPGAAIGEPWRALEQPELKQALESAPVLKTESLGEPARGVNTWEHWLVPNPDGRTWDALQVYFKEYYGPTWLYAVDLGTGQVKKQRLPDKRQFYLSGRALGFDGKYYIATPGPGKEGSAWGMFMHVYDPATNTLEDRGEIVPNLGGEVRPLVVGPDGRIYGTGSRDKGRLGLYIYDPKLNQVVKDFGPIGPSHPNGAWSGYVMGVDDTHVYLVSGMIPSWYLVAVNIETGQQKVLLEMPTDVRMETVESFPGAWLQVPQHGDAPQKDYWLYHGEMIAKANDTPPWPKRPSPWDKAIPKPELYWDQIHPDAEGHAKLWYRSAEHAQRAKERGKATEGAAADMTVEELGWKSVPLEGVETYAVPICPLVLMHDGRLYGTGGYHGNFIFDPKTGQTVPLGRNNGLWAYTNIVCGDKVVSSGYPAGPIVVFDPRLPWTVTKGGPPNRPAPWRTHPASNPREMGSLGKDTRVAIAHCSAMGADGRIYFGGFGERNYTAGGFGWYDPKTEKIGGFWKPLSGHAVFWLASLQGGRLIAMSTRVAPNETQGSRTPDEARLFFYDVNEGRIVREVVPVPKAPGTGLIFDAAPDRLLGLTVDPEHADGSLLYGVDAATGDVLFRKALPWPVSSQRRHWYGCWVDSQEEYYDLVRGPDGFAWTWLKNVLVRINPKDASVHVVGKIDRLGLPTFVGNDVYFSGIEQLRRIRNIVPAPSPLSHE